MRTNLAVIGVSTIVTAIAIGAIDKAADVFDKPFVVQLALGAIALLAVFGGLWQFDELRDEHPRTAKVVLGLLILAVLVGLALHGTFRNGPTTTSGRLHFY